MNGFVGVVVLMTFMLFVGPATASTTVGEGNNSGANFKMASVEPPAPDYTSSRMLQADILDLLQAGFADHEKGSLYETLGKALLVQSPWSINMFAVEFQCATENAHTNWINSAPGDQVFAGKDLIVDLDAEPASFSSLDEARLEAASRLPRDARHESGFLLYERNDGSIGISEKISGDARSLAPIRLANLAGRTVTIKGVHGVDGNYPMLEIVHTHPPHSTHLHSGGQGEGDVYVAESLGINVSVVHDNAVHLYQPKGRDISHRFHQVRGELVAMLDNHQH
ncbi:MAG TPA: hypothetical protein VIC08_09040 [Cellvibrionaceae bacterium]